MGKLPSRSEIVLALQIEKDDHAERMRYGAGGEVQGFEDGPLEVRLCVDLDGAWAINTGDVQFDRHHTDICAAGEIDEDTDCTTLADALLDAASAQADQLAEEQSLLRVAPLGDGGTR